MIVWGSNTLDIESRDLGAACKVCDTGRVSLAAFQQVFTVYWIPIFPLKKIKQIVCPTCTTTYPLEAYSEYLNPRETKFKTPLLSYLGLIIIVAICFIGYISVVNSEKRITEFKNNPTVGSYFIFKSSENDSEAAPYAFAKIDNVTPGKIIVYYSKYSYSKENLAVKGAELTKSQAKDLLSVNISKLNKNDFNSIDIKTILQ